MFLIGCLFNNDLGVEAKSARVLFDEQKVEGM